jgi:hypothetical protein
MLTETVDGPLIVKNNVQREAGMQLPVRPQHFQNSQTN